MATPTRIIGSLLTRIYFRRQIFRYCLNNRRQICRTNKTNIRDNLRVKFGLFGIPIAFATVMASGDENKALIAESEAFYEKKAFKAMYDHLLPHKECNDANVLWRLARAATELGKELGGESRKTHIYEAFEYAKEALKLDESNFACHKWYGILLDYTAEYEGTKQRISNAFLVKEHFSKAIELNPSDATTMYCLGYWCFLFADMPWIQRKAASLIFASPPTSTYEEALKHFEDAEKAEPGFYAQNFVMIGKTILKLKGDKERAKEVLLKAANYPEDGSTSDDNQAKKDAKEMLKKEFGITV